MIYVKIYKHIYIFIKLSSFLFEYLISLLNYKELPCAIMEAGECQICSVGQRAGNPGKLLMQIKLEGSLLENFALPGEASLLVLFRPLSDWTKPTHIMEAHLLYPKITAFSVNVSQKHYPS